MLLSLLSEAVSVWLPAVLKVTLSVFVPAERAERAGRDAKASLEEMATVSLTFVTRFQ